MLIAAPLETKGLAPTDQQEGDLLLDLDAFLELAGMAEAEQKQLVLPNLEDLDEEVPAQVLGEELELLVQEGRDVLGDLRVQRPEVALQVQVFERLRLVPNHVPQKGGEHAPDVLVKDRELVLDLAPQFRKVQGRKAHLLQEQLVFVEPVDQVDDVAFF